MFKEIFFAVPDGRVLFYDLLPLGAGGLPVSATAARIATHAHAMPPATQPAVTQASPILFGCRVLDGQVFSGEHLHDGGLRAGRVVVERAVGLYFFKPSIVEYLHSRNCKHMLVTTTSCSPRWFAVR